MLLHLSSKSMVLKHMLEAKCAIQHLVEPGPKMPPHAGKEGTALLSKLTTLRKQI